MATESALVNQLEQMEWWGQHPDANIEILNQPDFLECYVSTLELGDLVMKNSIQVMFGPTILAISPIEEESIWPRVGPLPREMAEMRAQITLANQQKVREYNSKGRFGRAVAFMQTIGGIKSAYPQAHELVNCHVPDIIVANDANYNVTDIVVSKESDDKFRALLLASR